MNPSSNNLRESLRPAWSGLILPVLLLLIGCSRSPAPVAEPAGERVVSLAPSLTEIICAIGAEKQLVGRTSACDTPPEKVNAIPVIGGFGTPSLDLLLKIKPTLVLDMDLQDESVGKMIDHLGLKRKRIACSTLEDIPRAILQVGRLLHSEASARALADHIRGRVAELRQAAENRKTAGLPVPSVFVEIWGDPLITVGKRSFISELIALAGGRNLGDEVTNKDYFPVSSEWVISRDPDVILCLYMTKTRGAGGQRLARRSYPSEVGSEVRDLPDDLSAEALAKAATGQSVPRRGDNSQLTPALDRVSARTGWAQIKAVQTHRVYGDLDNNVILRPGPRVLEGIKMLQPCLQDDQRQGHGENEKPETFAE